MGTEFQDSLTELCTKELKLPTPTFEKNIIKFEFTTVETSADAPEKAAQMLLLQLERYISEHQASKTSRRDSGDSKDDLHESLKDGAEPSIAPRSIKRENEPAEASGSTEVFNPISRLNRLAQQNTGVPIPVYSLVEPDGPRMYTFMYECVYSGETATGGGESKQKAKTASAQAMLDNLEGEGDAGKLLAECDAKFKRKEGIKSESTAAKGTPGTSSATTKLADTHPGLSVIAQFKELSLKTSTGTSSPISKVQEWFQKLQFPAPTYKIEISCMQPPEFYCSVEYRRPGEEKNGTLKSEMKASKKDAKTDAARKLLEILAKNQS